MTSISKLLALAVFGVAAATISSASPSQAQTERQAGGPAAIALPACCSPAQRPVITNAAWTVTPPGGPTINAVAVTNPNPGWHATTQGAQWIANVANAGMNSHPGGPYVYRTTFCLCAVPKGLASFPAGMYLQILADNSFVAKLNTNSFASGGNTSFLAATNVNVPASYFVAGNNVLEITVTNLPGSPTGLAVSGWIAGYFQQVLPGGHCP